jgi:hypothetical protein
VLCCVLGHEGHGTPDDLLLGRFVVLKEHFQEPDIRPDGV